MRIGKERRQLDSKHETGLFVYDGNAAMFIPRSRSRTQAREAKR
jgi:hypothetical protein